MHSADDFRPFPACTHKHTWIYTEHITAGNIRGPHNEGDHREHAAGKMLASDNKPQPLIPVGSALQPSVCLL